MMTTTTTPKRKAVDQVNYDFSDFSLSSPATKIRRLDYGELAPIMEEDEQEEEIHMSCSSSSSSSSPSIQEEKPGEVENEERAIVLFNPNANLSPPPPRTFSLTPHILSRLKQAWPKHSNLLNHSSSDLNKEEEDDDSSNQCLAVVPWVHSHLDAPMMTQANQQDCASMDIEQPPLEQDYDTNGYYYAASILQAPSATQSSFGFHHWQQHQQQQQHCMVPSQLPHNAAAAAAAAASATATPPIPVVWFH